MSTSVSNYIIYVKMGISDSVCVRIWTDKLFHENSVPQVPSACHKSLGSQTEYFLAR